MPNLLFEIGCEELPSWYVEQVEQEAVAHARRLLAEAQLDHGAIEGFATPRRIAILVRDLSAATSRRTELRRGPPASAAFDDAGVPRRAAHGFAEANNIAVEALTVRDTDRGRYAFAEIELGGEPAARVLPGILERLVDELPAPRKMRWADVKTPFVRPIAWLTALLDDELLPLTIAGVSAAAATQGHRFLSPECITLGAATDYEEALGRAFVRPRVAERLRATWDMVAAVGETAAVAPLRDEALLREVANLVEYPVAVVGEFDPRFLALPEEVLTTTMIHHQRFFPTRKLNGALAPKFVAVSNNRVPDESVLATGYRRVLEGRLFDAEFFWSADRGKGLVNHAQALAGIGFHRKLGSLADKVVRAGKVASRLAERVSLDTEVLATLTTASSLFKADLATEMVGEFPELEGTMARIYALEEGLPAPAAQALEEAVRPKSGGDDIPASPAGAVMSAADRADTIVAFFGVGERPSGSADPFALRRQATALCRILCGQGWELTLADVLGTAAQVLAESGVGLKPDTLAAAEQFVWERAAGLLQEEGVPVGLVVAATADRPAILVAARRAHLLAALIRTEGMADLLALYKRAANLARESAGGAEARAELFGVPQEQALHSATLQARESIESLMSVASASWRRWDLGRGPGAELAGVEGIVDGVLRLKAPLDDFLDNVLVMVEDVDVRENRLALLRDVTESVKPLGALERLEGLQPVSGSDRQRR